MSFVFKNRINMLQMMRNIDFDFKARITITQSVVSVQHILSNLQLK